MKGSLTLIAAALSFAAAQDVADVPACAEQAALSSISATGCDLTDFSCICKDTSFFTSLLPVVEKDCSAADLNATIIFTEQLCQNSGVNLNTEIPGLSTLVTSATSAASSGSPVVPTTTSVTAAMTAATTTASTTTASTTSASPTSNDAYTVARSEGFTALAGLAIAAIVMIG
ncbi:hypothetical protein MMC19_001662 [Ptychographa xylographoides]|nr:hypothetical protein [Ptychographa xylographoides]